MLGMRCSIIPLPQEDHVRFHTGPKNEPDQSTWLRRIGREDARGLDLRVCSNYFRDADYEHNLSVLRSFRQNMRHLRLKPKMVPTFSLPVVEPLEKHNNTMEGQTSGTILSSSLSECCSAPLLGVPAYSTRPTLLLYCNIFNFRSRAAHDTPGAMHPIQGAGMRRPVLATVRFKCEQMVQ